MTVSGDRRTVLMADDDDEDCFLAKKAFEASGMEIFLFCAENGIKLMSYLAGCLGDGTGLPDLILLDLNMPMKDGREALVEIKSDPVLQRIPIVILTTSQEEKDIKFCMEAGASSFITKPATFNEWVVSMKSVAEHWPGLRAA